MAKRILVVEDDTALRQLISLSLSRVGYEVLETGLGSTVMPLAIQHKPDLIILDVILPEGSGVDVSTELRKNPETRGIPIMMMTILTSGSNMSNAHWRQQYGVEEFITKPFQIDFLVGRVQWLLQ
jgi:two-component system phosphate regulon response regulator PhoB